MAQGATLSQTMTEPNSRFRAALDKSYLLWQHDGFPRIMAPLALPPHAPPPRSTPERVRNRSRSMAPSVHLCASWSVSVPPDGFLACSSLYCICCVRRTDAGWRSRRDRRPRVACITAGKDRVRSRDTAHGWVWRDLRRRVGHPRASQVVAPSIGYLDRECSESYRFMNLLTVSACAQGGDVAWRRRVFDRVSTTGRSSVGPVYGETQCRR